MEQNLLRLNDIVDEVEAQVGAIRSQAQRAARYRDVSTELEQLWVGLVSDDFRRQTMLQEDLTTRRENVSAALKETQELRKQADNASTGSEEALNAVDDEIRILESGRAELRTRIASMETTLRHQSTRESELESELKRLHRQLAVMNSRVKEAKQEERHLARVFEQERQKQEEYRTQQNACDLHLKELRDELECSQQGIEDSREKLLVQVHENSALASRTEEFRSEEEAVARRLAELTAAHQQQSDEFKSLDEKLAQLKQNRTRAADGLRQARNSADQLLELRDSLGVRRSDARESLADLREQRSAAMARRSVLEDLEDRQEGFGIGVREIPQPGHGICTVALEPDSRQRGGFA